MNTDNDETSEVAIAELHRRRQVISVLKNPELQNATQSVKERLELHARWLSSSGKEGRQFQVQGEDFTGVDFHGVDLRRAMFNGCKLDYCNFYGANLGQGVQLWRCSIRNSQMLHANLENTQFVECTVEDTGFQYATFNGVSITGIWTNDTATPTSNNFSHCTIVDSMFFNFSFFGARAAGVKLENVEFNNCCLAFLDLTGAILRRRLRLYRCNAIYLKLSGQAVDDAEFIECNLTNAEFDQTQMPSADFSRSNLTRASFRKAAAIKSKFNMVSGTNMTFFAADLHDSEMRLSTFQEANFYQSKLYGADLAGSNLTAALMNDTTNTNMTNFSGCTWVNGKRCKVGSIGVCQQE
jgi:uncharacterized protein YjbI with pentapeptide repeats